LITRAFIGLFWISIAARQAAMARSTGARFRALADGLVVVVALALVH
jgi:hypothetical protein